MTTLSNKCESGAGTNRGRAGRNAFSWFERIWEILIVVSVAPATVYGILSLNDLPIV